MKQMIQTQSGRSMVEMLGVLAIIGVLSVGGIAGYKSAMNQHTINQVLQVLEASIVELNALRNTGTPNAEGVYIVGPEKIGPYYGTLGVSDDETASNSLKLGRGDFSVGLRTSLASGLESQHIPVSHTICKQLVSQLRSHPLTGRINTPESDPQYDLVAAGIYADRSAYFYFTKEGTIADTCTAANKNSYAYINCCPDRDWFLNGVYGNLDQ